MRTKSGPFFILKIRMRGRVHYIPHYKQQASVHFLTCTKIGINGTLCVGIVREIQALKEKYAAKDRIMQALLQVQQQKEAEIQALKEKDGQREEQIRHLTAMVMRLQK